MSESEYETESDSDYEEEVKEEVSVPVKKSKTKEQILEERRINLAAGREKRIQLLAKKRDEKKVEKLAVKNKRKELTKSVKGTSLKPVPEPKSKPDKTELLLQALAELQIKQALPTKKKKKKPAPAPTQAQAPAQAQAPIKDPVSVYQLEEERKKKAARERLKKMFN
jgi:hypothetical protein|tara:strand:- start:521 stop:1021 length:501 start_codon:yes stop_codon:yes gene_type:complete